MKIQGQERILAKSEPGIHGSSKNGDGPGLVSDPEFRSSEIGTSGSAAGNDRGSSSSLARTATGPRTPRGKDRSKRNALKHGIFSKMVLLRGESQSDFDSLLSGLRDDLRPEGTLEEILVDKLASLIWRYRRLLMAEGAEIRKGTDFFHLEEAKRLEDEELRIVNSEGDDRAGMLPKISNPFILQRCVNLLRTLEFMIEKSGFHPSPDMRILGRVFGEFASSGGRHHVMYFYLQCSKDAELSDEERQKKGRPSTAECRANFVKELKRQIDVLETYGETKPEFEAPKKELDAISRNVPDTPQLDRLLRYEASLERNIDRTLSQLERFQRMRLGQSVPPSINLNVTTSKE
jgi:hypothetical protein